MAQQAIPLWRELEHASRSSLLKMTGGFHVDDQTVLDRERAAIEECGAACAPLDASRVSWLDAGGAPGLWVDEMGVISADATVSALHTVAGTTVLEDNKVEAIETGDGVVVRTASSSFSARSCVVAAG